MNAVNSCIFSGFVASDPRINQVSSKSPRLIFDFISSKDNPALHLECVAFATKINFIVQNISLGAFVLVQGRLKENSKGTLQLFLDSIQLLEQQETKESNSEDTLAYPALAAVDSNFFASDLEL